MEAVHIELEKRHTEKVQQARGLDILRQAGLAMEGGRHRALADAMMPFRPETFPAVRRSKRRWHGCQFPYPKTSWPGEANADEVRFDSSEERTQHAVMLSNKEGLSWCRQPEPSASS
jgi:hypothetical protein